MSVEVQAQAPAGDRPAPLGAGAFLAVILLLAAIRIAVQAVSPLGLQADEAQYWIWSQAPAFGYFSKPPLIAWAIAATTAVFGDGPSAVRLSAPLAHVATAFLVFLLARRLAGPRAAWMSGLAFATLPGVFFSAMLMSTDALLLPLWTLALLAFERATATGGRGWWLATGLAIGCGLLAKYAMAYFVLGAIVYLVWNPPARAGARGDRPVWAIVPALLVFSTNLAWNAAHGWASFGHTAANANLGGHLFNFDELGEFAASQLGVFGPLTALAFFAALRAACRRGTSPATRFLVSFSVPVLVLMLGQAFLSRAHANWAATAYVAATILAMSWMAETGRLRLAMATIGLHAALGALFLATVAAGRVPGIEPGSPRDPFKALSGWDALAEGVAAARAAHPGAIVVADEREHLVQLMYRLRPDGLGFAKWNPFGAVHDHFDLFFGLEGAAGRDLIVVTRAEKARPFRRYGEGIEPIATLDTRPGDERGTYRLWLLRGFRGYQEP